MKSKKLYILTECAIMVALGVVLSMFAVFKLPNGGSVTVASMVPVIIVSLRHNVKWGLLTSITYALVQMAIGFYPPPTGDMVSFALVVLLDYVIAFGVLGLAGSLASPFRHPMAKVAIGGGVVLSLRFLCHFVSGILIWSSFAPEGQPVWLYSLVYNASYMLAELIITLSVLILLSASPILKKHKT